MTRYVFRGLGARKLRTALTALAVVLADGHIVDDLRAPTPDGVADRLQRLGA